MWQGLNESDFKFFGGRFLDKLFYPIRTVQNHQPDQAELEHPHFQHA
jgi:hypothetical protein